MAFLERLGWTKDHVGNLGQYESVEKEDGLASNESAEASLRDQHRALLESHRRLKLWLRGLSVALGLLLTALILAITNSRSSFSNAKLLTPVPEMPIKLVKFEQNETFAGPSTPENDQAWSAMMPPGDGFIIVTNPQSYNLPPGKSTKHGDVYDISMFHQLHCLAHIRNHYYLTQEALHSENSEAIEKMLLGPQEEHVHHCFDYLRQGVMCTGDMTVEWPRTEEDGRRFAVDGWGVTHECKSWDAIMAFMEENSVTSRIWTA